MDASVITARCFHSGGASYGIERGVQPAQLMKIGRWKSADVFFNNYVAARPAKDTTDKMLGVVNGTPTARNSLSAIQIREAVIKSSVNRSVIEDIDEEDISEEKVEIIDMEKDMDLSFRSEDKSDEMESDELESDEDNDEIDKMQEYSGNSYETEENSDNDDISYHS